MLVSEAAVINASPLIFLSRGSHLDLLHHFAESIHVPEPVAAEIRKRGSEDITVKTLDSVSWLEVIPAPAVPNVILEWGLGPGESSVLAMARYRTHTVAIIDDLAGRRCAASLGVPVRGTLGIVLAAKNRGLIPSARAVMEDLIQAGLYLSPPILGAALKRVGE